MQKAAPQAPEVPACGAAFAVCGVLDRCMELEAMYRKGWQDAEKLVQWYRAAKAEKHKPNTTRKGLPGMGRPFLCVYDLTWITLEGESISAFPCT